MNADASAPTQASTAAGRSPGLLFRLLVILAIGAVGGLWSASWALRGHAGFGRVNIGPWTTYPRIGTFDVDPYARAAIMRRGELPLGAGEGVAFIAAADDDGRPLNGRCDYRVRGNTPIARGWTLTAHRPDGGLFVERATKHGLTSGEVVRESDGRVTIFVARRARPMNWLPLPTDDAFLLALRLYDTAASSLGRALEPALLPRIERVRCI